MTMPDDAFPRIKTSDVDLDDEVEMLEGLSGIYDIRMLDYLCRATGRDTIEYVRDLLAIIHGDEVVEVEATDA